MFKRFCGFFLVVCAFFSISPLVLAQDDLGVEFESQPNIVDAERHEAVVNATEDERREDADRREDDAKRLGVDLDQLPIQGQSSGNINPYDIYEYNKSDLKFTADHSEIIPGELVILRGTVKNGMDVPIAGGSVYAKVFRQDEDTATKGKNGDHKIDSFFLIDNINIGPGQEKEYKGNWQAPSTLPNGSYYIGLYFINNQRYNLAGVNFLEDGFADKINFQVESTVMNGIVFDKNSVTINDKKHVFRGPEQIMEKDERITVVVPLKNNTARDRSVELTKSLFRWDDLDEKNRIWEETETVTIAANTTQNIEVSTKENNSPEYLAKFEVEGSEVTVRFRRLDVSKPRLNFPTITKFPPSVFGKYSLFVSYHNMAFDAQEDAIIVLTLYDRADNQIAKFEHEAKILPRLSGYQEDFRSKGGYKYLRLKAEIFSVGGRLIDIDEVVYDCSLFDAEVCDSGLAGLFTNTILTWILIIVLVIGLSFGGYIFYKKMKVKQGIEKEKNGAKSKQSMVQMPTPNNKQK